MIVVVQMILSSVHQVVCMMPRFDLLGDVLGTLLLLHLVVGLTSERG